MMLFLVILVRIAPSKTNIFVVFVIIVVYFVDIVDIDIEDNQLHYNLESFYLVF